MDTAATEAEAAQAERLTRLAAGGEPDGEQPDGEQPDGEQGALDRLESLQAKLAQLKGLSNFLTSLPQSQAAEPEPEPEPEPGPGPED
eukprot:COSAG04_NODE_8597_length_953_cov_0.855972_1_plen_87_part_10